MGTSSMTMTTPMRVSMLGVVMSVIEVIMGIFIMVMVM